MPGFAFPSVGPLAKRVVGKPICVAAKGDDEVVGHGRDTFGSHRRDACATTVYFKNVMGLFLSWQDAWGNLRNSACGNHLILSSPR